MAGHEVHPHPTVLSDFILGSQDGLVNVLGILLGLVAANTSEPKLLLVAALAALAAESISMGAVAYTTTYARRQLFLSEVERERREMATVPEEERNEVRVILRDWGYQGEEVEEMLRKIEAKPQAMLDIMMAFELHLAPVAADQARRSAALVGGSTVVGSIIPLVPFLVSTKTLVNDAIVSIILSAIMLFLVGWYEARTTLGSLWASGLRMVTIGLAAGFAGFLIGHFVAIA